DFGDGSPMINAVNPTHVFTDAGDYTVSLLTTGEGGCESVAQQIGVSVSEPPLADFAADPGPNTDLPLPGAEVSFSDQSQRALNWFWDFGDGSFSNEASPFHRYEQAGDYTVSLTITDEVGCVAESSQGPFTVILPDLFVPNVFSPNGDGIGDTYFIQYTGVETFFLQIRDRWGRNIFESNGPASGWNGTFNGANMAEGTYYYVLSIGENRYTGNITLLR
ncbi:MAG: PKD domain-containing protein, partial [Bacteroidota bacterium]